MDITLPRPINGAAPVINASCGPIVIIGANGAGKSRFSAKLAESLGEKAYCLSALNGLYSVLPADPLKSSVGKLYAQAGLYDAAISKASGLNELECLIGMLMHDEMVNLISYKLSHHNDEPGVLPPTRLDTVIDMWQDIFPGNRILIESGSLLFGRDSSSDRYSALKLSDGERAVIFYLAGVLYAPDNSAILISSPEMFLHPSIMQPLWSRIEALRPDCRFIYTTHDLEFAASRSGATAVWVRNYDPAAMAWDYAVLDSSTVIGEDVYQAIIGARKPVLFIEGDGIHSIDAKLYPLIFKEFTIKSLGSCNKVIEATRTFNDLNSLHHLDSYGIVDRDRRDEHEVEYLRGKRVMVPEVAEIENILMLEEVVRTVASSRGQNEDRVFAKVSNAIISQFASDLRQQALMHTRHRVKRTVECRIDGRFNSINTLEEHIRSLVDEIKPRHTYESLCRKFRTYVDSGDYAAILKVYNQKSMIPASNVPQLCGLKSKEEYTAAIIRILRSDNAAARRIRNAVKSCFGL